MLQNRVVFLIKYNKDGNVHRFELSSIRRRLLEREIQKERKRKKEIERKRESERERVREQQIINKIEIDDTHFFVK